MCGAGRGWIKHDAKRRWLRRWRLMAVALRSFANGARRLPGLSSRTDDSRRLHSREATRQSETVFPEGESLSGICNKGPAISRRRITLRISVATTACGGAQSSEDASAPLRAVFSSRALRPVVCASGEDARNGSSSASTGAFQNYRNVNFFVVAMAEFRRAAIMLNFVLAALG
jgi:hypothetical protein